MRSAIPSSQRILEAAIAAIDAGGEASLRVDLIAQEAQITKPSIYHFYGERDGLVAAAQAERYRRSMLIGLVESIEITRATTSRKEFEAILPAYVDVVMQPEGPHRRAQRIQVLGSAVSRPHLTAEVTAALERALELTTELVQIPFDRGWTTSAYDVDAIALWWLSNTQGRHLFDLIGNERLHEQWRKMTLAQLRHFYFGEA